MHPTQYADNLREAWATFLASYEWTFFATFTAKGAASADRMVREFRRLANRLRRGFKAVVASFYTVERTPAGVHLHALIWCSVAIPVRVVEAEWRMGISHVRRYDASRAGPAYVVKELGVTDLDEYDLSVTMPPQVRTGSEGVRGFRP